MRGRSPPTGWVPKEPGSTREGRTEIREVPDVLPLLSRGPEEFYDPLTRELEDIR